MSVKHRLVTAICTYKMHTKCDIQSYVQVCMSFVGHSCCMCDQCLKLLQPLGSYAQQSPSKCMAPVCIDCYVYLQTLLECPKSFSWKLSRCWSNSVKLSCSKALLLMTLASSSLPEAQMHSMHVVIFGAVHRQL